MEVRNKEQWNKQADRWEINVSSTIKNNILISWLKKYGKKKDLILDQGCSIGQYSFSVYSLGFKNVIGLDYSEKLINIARRYNKKFKTKIIFKKGDIRKMPFKKSYFDIVLSPGTIEHVPETEKTLSELSRVIKKNGYLMINVPHRISIFTLTKLLQKVLGIWPLGYEKSFTKGHFKKLLKKHGFEILDFKINRIPVGRKVLISKTIRALDWPLYKLGWGGHHMYFLCKKRI